MSTFSGKIKEIPGISVDRFDDDNLHSEAYFLSHCHSDHMVGIYPDYFKYNVIRNNKYIYASEISCLILKKMLPGLENNIKPLYIYAPTTIVLKDIIISVLCIPAGHCPGSVMFLFEFSNSRILYTGDYRIDKNDVCKFKRYFYDSFNNLKEIDKIYLDTTFFLKRFFKFPRRKESLEESCKIIKEWIAKSKNHHVQLDTSAKYGYEYLFKEIYKEIGMPIHVSPETFKLYCAIPEMDECVTLNGSSTQIHCSCGLYYKNICKKGSIDEIRTIRISAFTWTQDKLADGSSSKYCEDYFYVCYSTHASYEEGVALLRFLKPKDVEICVKHDDPATNSEMLELIEEVLDEFRPKAVKEYKHKLFENTMKESCVVEEETTYSDNDFGILDSPPRNSDSINKSLIKIDAKGTSCSASKPEVSLLDDSQQVCSIIPNKECDLGIQKECNVELECFINDEEPPQKKVK